MSDWWQMFNACGCCGNENLWEKWLNWSVMIEALSLKFHLMVFFMLWNVQKAICKVAMFEWSHPTWSQSHSVSDSAWLQIDVKLWCGPGLKSSTIDLSLWQISRWQEGSCGHKIWPWELHGAGRYSWPPERVLPHTVSGDTCGSALAMRSPPSYYESYCLVLEPDRRSSCCHCSNAWSIRLPPVSDDKGQYSMSRSRQRGDRYQIWACKSSCQGATGYCYPNHHPSWFV